MHSGDTLRVKLEMTYQAFSGFPCPRSLETSPLRDGEKILRSLTAAPLRQLTSEQIGPYAGWAITTVGSAADYRHFLPRILELAVETPTHLGLMPPVVAGRIVMGGWTNWPSQQRGAVLEVFRAAFEWAAEAHPDDTQTAPDWLCGLARLDQSIGGPLAFWRSSSSQNAVLQLGSFAMQALETMLENNGELGGFWEEIDPATRQSVSAWVRGAETRRQLESSLANVQAGDRWMIEKALKLARQTAN